jgi:hypothetical protein
MRACALETVGPLEELLLPKIPPRLSMTEPKPVEPEPTPAIVKLSANTTARAAKTHFVWLRSRLKNSVSSTGRLAFRSLRDGFG